MAKFSKFIAVLLLVSLSFSIGEEVINVKHITNGQHIYLGRIAKGQTFSIFIYPILDEGGKFGRGGRYDIAYAKNLPEGWKSKDSSLYGNPLEVVITVPSDASEGKHEFLLFIKDEGNQEGLGIKWFVGEVEVVSDSMAASSFVSPEYVGVRNPVNVFVNVRNNVDFGNTYYVKVSARDYLDKTTIYVPANSERQLVFSLSFDKEGKEEISVNVEETGNSDENYSMLHEVEVQESLTSEYKSIGEGIMLVPISQALPYYLSYLISSLFV